MIIIIYYILFSCTYYILFSLPTFLSCPCRQERGPEQSVVAPIKNADVVQDRRRAKALKVRTKKNILLLLINFYHFIPDRFSAFFLFNVLIIISLFFNCSSFFLIVFTVFYCFQPFLPFSLSFLPFFSSFSAVTSCWMPRWPS